MTFLSRAHFDSPPVDLSDLLLRDVASLLVTGRVVGRALQALRPECRFSPELTQTINAMLAISEAGELHLQEPLAESGALLPRSTDQTASALVANFFTRLPAPVGPGVLATEAAVNLRLLAQHLELKACLAAETAVLVGQAAIGRALIAWSAEWRNCGRALRAGRIRARSDALSEDAEAAGTTQPA